MTLKADIDKLLEKSKEIIPAETLALMEAYTERLHQSGILDKILKVGDKAPDFTLFDAHGEQIASMDLLAQGPLVVSFYRGGW